MRNESKKDLAVTLDIERCDEPILYVITPTRNRTSQVADLVRLKQTLMLVPNCVWIVVEDANNTSPTVSTYIRDFPRFPSH